MWIPVQQRGAVRGGGSAVGRNSRGEKPAEGVAHIVSADVATDRCHSIQSLSRRARDKSPTDQTGLPLNYRVRRPNRHTPTTNATAGKPMNMRDFQNTPDILDIDSQEPTNRTARLARLFNRTFPQSYAMFSLLPRLGLAYQWLRRLEITEAGSRLSQLPFEQYRTTDTVFVLGTGASINTYPPEWWAVVRNHDSIGMNFFLLHEHVPTFHVMEDVGGLRRSLLTTRYVERGDYQHVPLIVKTQLTNLSTARVTARIDELNALPPEVLGNTYLSVDLLAAGRTIKDMEASYRTLRRLGLWTPRPRFLMLTKRRGSVTYIINLAVRAGYRRVVLCGIDLNHTEHFYDSRREELKSKGLPVPLNEEHGTVHSTNDPSRNPVTVRDVILGIKRTLLDPMGVELMVGSSTSALYPAIPLLDWEQATLASSDSAHRDSS